ncbi:unnamed protein product, partial [Larinioides sclopetarius]
GQFPVPLLISIALLISVGQFPVRLLISIALLISVGQFPVQIISIDIHISIDIRRPFPRTIFLLISTDNF